MSLAKDQQEELFSAGNELPGYLPEDDPMVVFGRELYPVFSDEDFAGCYSTKGRHAISPAFLARVTLLQFRENLSDPETAESVVRRLDWKIALRLRLRENVSFDPSTLCVYRKRLRESQAMTLIFDRIVALAQEKGFIQRRTKQRVDATHIIAHVNRISTTDLLFRTVKCLVEEIEAKDPKCYEQELPEHIRERYSNRFSSFGLSKDKRAEKLAEIVEDGLYLKALLKRIPSEELSELRQLPIMETIFAENVTITTKTIEEKVFVEVAEIQTPHQTLFDPRDTSLKMGKKGKTSWVGAKCHIVETAEKGQINFITNMIYQRANEDDSRVHERIRAGNEKRGFQPETIYTDMNYISGTAIQDYRDRGMELMGYIQGDTSSKPEAFRVQKFAIDVQTRTAVCPAGQHSRVGGVRKDGDIGIPFSANTCRGCVNYEECVGANTEKRRVLRVSPQYDRICERREVQQTESFRQEMRVRAQVEGTISEGVRFFGLRRARYRGADGQQMQFYLTGAAMNVKRLITAMMQGRAIRSRTPRACTA